jgi:hypothetical protein
VPVQVVVVCVSVALLVVVLGRVAYQWIVFRRRRLIDCPENRRPAGVQLDAWHAAWTSVGKTPGLRLSACTRWPERAGCGQQCLSQIEAAPHECEVRRILSAWYQGKKCVSCGQPIGETLWSVQKPALLTADKTTVEWSQIPVDRLREVLERSAPICFACHMASTLVREHPELAVERPRGHAVGG